MLHASSISEGRLLRDLCICQPPSSSDESVETSSALVLRVARILLTAVVISGDTKRMSAYDVSTQAIMYATSGVAAYSTSWQVWCALEWDSGSDLDRGLYTA